MGQEVRVTFYEFDSARPAWYFKNPEPAYIRTAVLVSQSTSHRNLGSICLQKIQVRWLGRAAHERHFWTIFKNYNKAHE